MSGTQVRDEELIRALYAEHGQPLLAFAHRLMGRDRAAAEDIVQETLLRAWRNADHLAPDSVRPWLFTTARHLAIDAHRARRARPHESSGELPDLPVETVDSYDSFDAALTSAVVVDALRSLTAVHRAVLIDFFYRGRTAAEIAAERGMPAGTARSRLYYAMRALRLALQERGVNGP